jgi:hypothetical protein
VGIGEREQMTLMTPHGEFGGEPAGVVTHTVPAGFKATADEEYFQEIRARPPLDESTPKARAIMDLSLHIAPLISMANED